MKSVLLLLISVLFAAQGGAQTILLKDGKRVTPKSIRRQGDNIMAQSPSVAGAPAVQGEVGYPLAQIEKIEFPEPAVLKTAPDLLANGKAAEGAGATRTSADLLHRISRCAGQLLGRCRSGEAGGAHHPRPRFRCRASCAADYRYGE
jgi:hypothetical protein